MPLWPLNAITPLGGKFFFPGDALLIVFVKVSINVNVMDSALSQPFVYPGYLGITKYSTVLPKKVCKSC